jgi:hypothetical protein
MWYILGFHNYFCIVNDMSWVHGSVDPVNRDGLPSQPWVNRNGGQCSLPELGVQGSRMWELDTAGQRER